MEAGNIRNICIIYNYVRRGLCQKVTIVGDFVAGSVGAVVGASTGGKQLLSTFPTLGVQK